MQHLSGDPKATPDAIRIANLLHAFARNADEGPVEGMGRLLTDDVEAHVDGDRASAFSYFQFVSGDQPAAILVTGSHRDELIRCEDDRWLLARREVST